MNSNNCNFCNCDYKDLKQHMCSLTHLTNEANYYLLQRKNRDDSEYKQRENVIAEYNEYIEDKEFSCVKCVFYSEDKDAMLQHEESCLGVQVNRVESVYECLECQDCGFKVEMKGQKMKPKYIMNAHKKTCLQNRRKRVTKFITDYIANAKDEDVYKLFNYIKRN